MNYRIVSIIMLLSLPIVNCRGPKGDNGVNGAQGTQGQQGTPGTSVQAQPFCPNIAGGIGFQEQYITIAGQAYAVYYDGTHTFLALLKPGNYVTTDGRDCHFTVNSDGSII